MKQLLTTSAVDARLAPVGLCLVVLVLPNLPVLIIDGEVGVP